MKQPENMKKYKVLVTCDICAETFLDKENLKNHMEVHQGRKLLQYEGKTFPCDQYLPTKLNSEERVEKSTEQRLLLNRKNYKKRRKMKKWLWLRLTTTEFHPVKSTPQWSSVEALLILTTVVVSKIRPSEVGGLLPSQPFLTPPQILKYKKRRKMENWLWLRLTATEFHPVKSTPQWSAVEALLILTTVVVSTIRPSEV